MRETTEDIELRLLLEAIYLKYHYDFRGYSLASLKRRLKQARERFECDTISQLQDLVLHDATVLPELLSYLTVQVSELFRVLPAVVTLVWKVPWAVLAALA